MTFWINVTLKRDLNGEIDTNSSEHKIEERIYNPLQIHHLKWDSRKWKRSVGVSSCSNFHFLICCDAFLLDLRKWLTFCFLLFWEHGLIPHCSDWGVHLSWANIPSWCTVLHFHLTKYQWRIKRYRILVLRRTAHRGPEDVKSKKKIPKGCDLPITFTHLTKVSRTYIFWPEILAPCLKLIFKATF